MSDDRAGGPRRKRWPRVMGGVGLGVAGLLLGSYLIPVTTSGTLSYREAAPAGTQFVEVAGVDIAVSHYPFTGTGNTPPLFVLLHGFGASSFSWRDVVDPLSRLGPVVTYDRTGFGFSERPTSWEGENPYGSVSQCRVLADLVEKFRAADQEVVLVGHSAGGTLALDCAIHRDLSPTRLVLIAPAALSGGGPSGIRLVRFVPPLDRLGPLLVQGISESGNQVLSDSVVDQSILTDAVLAGYRAPLEVSGWERGLWEFTLSPRRAVTSEALEQLPVPTLVMTGDSDTIVPPADSQAISQALPDSSLVVFDGTGHLPQEEQPGRTLEEISRFLDVTGR